MTAGVWCAAVLVSHTCCGLQVAALMSGKYSLSVDDLYSVCAHWQQTAGQHPRVLECFGSAEKPIARQHIQRTLRYSPPA